MHPPRRFRGREIESVFFFVYINYIVYVPQEFPFYNNYDGVIDVHTRYLSIYMRVCACVYTYYVQTASSEINTTAGERRRRIRRTGDWFFFGSI